MKRRLENEKSMYLKSCHGSGRRLGACVWSLFGSFWARIHVWRALVHGTVSFFLLDWTLLFMLSKLVLSWSSQSRRVDSIPPKSKLQSPTIYRVPLPYHIILLIQHLWVVLCSKQLCYVSVLCMNERQLFLKTWPHNEHFMNNELLLCMIRKHYKVQRTSCPLTNSQVYYTWEIWSTFCVRRRRLRSAKAAPAI